jgi:phosphoglycolate phosphatase
MTPAPVGFDLDMTLIDSRAAIMASFAGVAADTGVVIDPAGVDSRLGIKLQDELAHWFPPGEIEDAVRIYRSYYLRLLAPLTTRLPGAAEAIAAVRGAGARAVVITAKPELTARLSLDSVGLDPDELFGDAHGPEKAAVLTGLRAAVYVGDTPADMLAAVAANVRGVGVATGSFSASELRAAGAAHVLHSLDGFTALYASLTARGLPHGAYRVAADYEGPAQDAARRGRPARLTGRAPVSISPADFSVTSAPKASASSVTRRGRSSPGRYRSSTATRSASFSIASASSARASISTGPSPSSGCSWITMRASASSRMMSCPLRSLNRTVF